MPPSEKSMATNTPCGFIARLESENDTDGDGENCPKDRMIVKAIIDLAHNFSMRVVAEGVEDNETADVLQELGTDLLQGYWFSKPVAEAEFRKLL